MTILCQIYVTSFTHEKKIFLFYCNLPELLNFWSAFYPVTLGVYFYVLSNKDILFIFAY